MTKDNTKPENLYKYYRFDRQFNKSRLMGDIYLSSPLQFNDVFDCNLQITNNTNVKYLETEGDDRLKLKLRELGYTGNDLISTVNNLRNNVSLTVTEVRHKQLERAGVLCLTPEATSMLMWAHYANNDGFCIEYDTERLTQNIIIEFINSMDKDLTNLLAVDSRYCQCPCSKNKVSELDPDSKKKMEEKIEEAQSIFTSDCAIRNSYLADHMQEERLNFIRNIYIKRFAFEEISYKKKLPNDNPDLFFTQKKNNARIKYYTKFEEWSYEKERRMMVSLGGKKVLNVGTDCIKSITLGYHIKPNQFFEIISILKTLKFKYNFILYIINKSENGFKRKAIPLEELYEKHKDFSIVLDTLRK